MLNFTHVLTELTASEEASDSGRKGGAGLRLGGGGQGGVGLCFSNCHMPCLGVHDWGGG